MPDGGRLPWVEHFATLVATIRPRLVGEELTMVPLQKLYRQLSVCLSSAGARRSLPLHAPPAIKKRTHTTPALLWEWPTAPSVDNFHVRCEA
jgi:hypothetical protein